MTQNIIGISPCFPRPARPDYGPYAYKLYNEMARQGADISVIAPYPLIRVLSEKIVFRPNAVNKDSQSSIKRILRPPWWSWSTRVFPSSLVMRMNFNNFSRSVKRAAGLLPRPDWVSAYFFEAGCAALTAFGTRIPIYVEIGESDFKAYEQYMSPHEIGNWLKKFTGVIAVSLPNFKLIQHYADLGEKAFLLESGIDISTFRPRGRNRVRSILNLPGDAFIVGFTGSFIERKGPLRLLKALEKIPEAFGLFLGRGPQKPRGKKVLYSGQVRNEIVPLFLSACDLYCLPSLAESLSCAELEAAACGIPLVVSDRPFNRAFLSENHAIFIDPLSVDSIADGIKVLLRNQNLRDKMAVECRLLAQRYSLSNRVKRLFNIVSKMG